MTLAAPENLGEVESCAVCDSRERTTRFEQPPFRVVTCDGCGLVYVTPRLHPDVLPRVYDEGYWRSDSPSERGYADYTDEAPLYRRTFEKRLRFLKRWLPETGRALDVGCAAGFFLSVLRDHGWTVDGVEPSAVIARHAREAGGRGQIHVGTLETAPFPRASYDLVSLWDVVEHVPDPGALLTRATSHLRDGGHLIVETQNVASRFARALGPRWHHYKHLEHLYHFDPSTLTALLERAGLEVVTITSRTAGKYVSLAFVRERATRIHPLVSRALQPLAALDRWSAYVNPRDEIIAIARRAPARGDAAP